MMSSVARAVLRQSSKLVNSQNRKCLQRLPACCAGACHQRLCTTSVIPPAQPETAEKDYPPKIRQIVEDISRLTLIEVADLNELLKKTLNIQDAPMMAMGAMAQAAPAAKEEEEEAAPKQEKMSYTVKLTKFDDKKKVALIKEMKNQIEGMNLVQAKKFVESAPAVVRADIPKDEAEKLKEVLQAAGGTVEIE